MFEKDRRWGGWIWLSTKRGCGTCPGLVLRYPSLFQPSNFASPHWFNLGLAGFRAKASVTCTYLVSVLCNTQGAILFTKILRQYQWQRQFSCKSQVSRLTFAASCLAWPRQGQLVMEPEVNRLIAFADFGQSNMMILGRIPVCGWCRCLLAVLFDS